LDAEGIDICEVEGQVSEDGRVDAKAAVFAAQRFTAELQDDTTEGEVRRWGGGRRLLG
jgi:hypothetical protein